MVLQMHMGLVCHGAHAGPYFGDCAEFREHMRLVGRHGAALLAALTGLCVAVLLSLHGAGAAGPKARAVQPACSVVAFSSVAFVTGLRPRSAGDDAYER